MSWSLKISGGDLDVQSAQLGVVRGAQKLVQDFRCALLEELGNDDMQPGWGSSLSGGVSADGTYVPGIIGTHDFALVRLAIETEIRRIAALFQQRQLDRVKNERLTYNKVTLTASEILVGVTSVKMYQAADELIVIVTLQTGDNRLVDVTVPVADETLVAR